MRTLSWLIVCSFYLIFFLWWFFQKQAMLVVGVSLSVWWFTTIALLISIAFSLYMLIKFKGL